jgi:hypothetical protein
MTARCGASLADILSTDVRAAFIGEFVNVYVIDVGASDSYLLSAALGDAPAGVCRRIAPGADEKRAAALSFFGWRPK